MPSAMRAAPNGRSWWRRPLLWLGLWAVTYVAASAIPWTQLLGYRSLVFFAGLPWLSSPPLEAIVDWLGQPRHAIAAMLAGALLLAVQFWPSRVPRWRGREAGILLLGSLALLGTALILPELGWHVDHGYFPHEATFPSGHMSALLCFYLAVWGIGWGRWRRIVEVLAAPILVIVGSAIIAQSAHTIWDTLGPFFLALTVSSSMNLGLLDVACHEVVDAGAAVQASRTP